MYIRIFQHERCGITHSVGGVFDADDAFHHNRWSCATSYQGREFSYKTFAAKLKELSPLVRPVPTIRSHKPPRTTSRLPTSSINPLILLGPLTRRLVPKLPRPNSFHPKAQTLSPRSFVSPPAPF